MKGNSAGHRRWIVFVAVRGMMASVATVKGKATQKPSVYRGNKYRQKSCGKISNFESKKTEASVSRNERQSEHNMQYCFEYFEQYSNNKETIFLLTKPKWKARQLMSSCPACMLRNDVLRSGRRKIILGTEHRKKLPRGTPLK